MRRFALDNPLLPIIAYLGVIGVWAVLAGGVAPDSVEAGTPSWLGYGWSACMALGGFAAGAGTVTGRTRLESAGLSLIGVSLALFMWAAIVNGEAAGDDALGLAAMLGSVALRMRQLRRERQAVKIAEALARGGIFNAGD